MPDFVYLPHFNVPMERESEGRYAAEIGGVNVVALAVAHGWQIRFAATDDAIFYVEVEGRTLGLAEAALVKAMGRAEDVLTAGTVRVAGLGYVCALCAEVPGAVFEVEVERVNAAISQVQNAIDSIDGGVA